LETFLVRVELHGSPTSKDYDKLHAKMEAKGFSRTITGSSGTEYHLPHAEYELEGDFTKSEVLQKAKDAASQVWSDFGVMVTQSKGQSWNGLEKVA